MATTTRYHWVAVVAGLAAAVGLFAPNLGSEFVWDDHGVIEQNPAVTGAHPLHEAVVRDLWYAQEETQAVRLVYYRPLWVLAARGLWALGGGAPWPFHSVSLLLHLANVVLTFVVVGRLSAPRWAGPVALLYAVHPLVCEAVSWAAAFGDVLVLTAVLVGLLAATMRRSAASPGARAAADMTGLLASTTAVFTKESGVAVALLVTAEALSGPRCEVRRRLANVWPVWVPVLAYIGLRGWFIGFGGNAPAFDDLWGRIVTAATVFAWDLQRLVWPFPLSPVHSGPEPSTARTLAALATCGAAFVGLSALARWRPRATFWAMWILLPLIPPIAQVFSSNGNRLLFAERYLYMSVVPTVFVIIRAAGALADAHARVPRVAGPLVLGAVTILLGLPTARHASAWNGDETHAERTLSVYPDNWVALTALGRAMLAKSDPASALRLFEAAATGEPRNAIVHLNVAISQQRLGRSPEAIRAFRRALEVDPANVPALLGLGDSLRAIGDLDGAGSRYAAAVSVAPGSVEARLALGGYLFTKGDANGAMRHWEVALASRPDSCELLYNVGLGRIASGQPSAALEPLGRFLANCVDGYDAQRAKARQWIEQR